MELERLERLPRGRLATGMSHRPLTFVAGILPSLHHAATVELDTPNALAASVVVTLSLPPLVAAGPIQ